MSVNASTTVSIVPASTAPRSPSSESIPGRAAVLPDSGTVTWSLLSGGASWLAGQFLLDGGQLLGRALHLRALEPVVRRDQPVDPREAEHDAHRHDRVVEVRPGDRAVDGQDEQDADDRHPGHRDPADHVAPPAQVPGPPLEALAPAQPQEGGHHVGDVEPITAIDVTAAYAALFHR